MKSSDNAAGDRETLLVGQLAAGISIFSFLTYLSRGDLLLYGDAVAHINIARRVFDSRTPGLLQLGTVWLPLPHLLMVPFLLSYKMWQTGTGGSIPSMIAYVLSVLGIFRLVRGAVRPDSEIDLAARVAPWFAAAVYALNPNLIYLQSTAMTEPLYLAFFIWAVVHFAEFVREVSSDTQQRSSTSLMKCGWCLIGGCLTRYDGWLLAATMCVAALFVWQRAKRNGEQIGRSFAKFVLLAAFAPLLWLAYNAAAYHNPLEFANGPYSAKAIEQRTAASGTPPHPGTHNLPVAFSFFLKSAELNVACADIVEKLWVVLLLAGTAIMLVFDRRLWPLLLLWIPVPFYALSISYSGVPIFLPVWWPHSYYNVRYGIELLPAFAAFPALALNFLLHVTHIRSVKIVVGVAALLMVAGSYISVWHKQPVCLQEAQINSRDRIIFERALAANLHKLPPASTLLMYVGDHVGALQSAGIPLRQVINEGNHRPWKKPLDPNGLWEHALNDPEQYADYVVAAVGDPVANAVNVGNLSPMVVIHSSGEPEATIYWTHREDGNPPR